MSEQAVFDTLRYRIKVDEYGTRRYYNNVGLLHRINGPAVECRDGHKEWLQNGLLHRADGAAIEFTDGGKFWYQNGRLHRENGPAIEWADGSMEWLINGVELSEVEFNQRVKKCLK